MMKWLFISTNFRKGSFKPPSSLYCGQIWLVYINPTNGKGISSFLYIGLVWFELKSAEVEES